MATNPYLQLRGAPGAGTSAFATGNFGDELGKRPAGQPKVPPMNMKGGPTAAARLAAAILASKVGVKGATQKQFLA